MPQPGLSMQCDSSPREEEVPPLFWGLDPIFLAFAKLYIKDILEMKESQQMPGMWPVSLRDAPCCTLTAPFPSDTENQSLRASEEPSVNILCLAPTLGRVHFHDFFVQSKDNLNFFKLNRSLRV